MGGPRYVLAPPPKNLDHWSPKCPHLCKIASEHLKWLANGRCEFFSRPANFLNHFQETLNFGELSLPKLSFFFFFFFFLSVGAHFTSPFWRGGYVRLVANVSWSSSGLQESDRTWLGEGFARLVLPEDITSVLWPGGSATSRRTSAITPS